MNLTFTQQKSKVQVEKRDGETLKGVCLSAFRDDSHYCKAAEVLGVRKSDLLKWLDDFRVRGITSVAIPDQVSPKPVFKIRGRLQIEAQAQTFDSFESALSAPCSVLEPLIYWNGTTEIAALDIDYHNIPMDERLSIRELESLAARVQPKPFMSWVTHGRGLRLMYQKGKLDADEYAAIGGMSFSALDPVATIEIKSITRHPYVAIDGRHCSEIKKYEQSDEFGPVLQWLGTRSAEPEDVENYLESNGLVRGRRYDHSKCPARPERASHGDPVVPGDAGIYCHSCANMGITHGSRRPGWFPYSFLIGGTADSMLRACLNNFTHWSHARFVVESLCSLPHEVAKLAYSAALKALHGPEDPRIRRAMTAGKGFIRFRGAWGTESAEMFTKPIHNTIRSLPICHTIDGKVNEVTAERLAQSIDLSSTGYPAVSPVWGSVIYRQFLTTRDTNSFPAIFFGGDLARESMAPFRPEYLPDGKRPITEEEAWCVIERVFPGINRNLVQLLIAAKGCAEGGEGMPPMIFITGPTGAGKSTSVHVAASICGDRNSELVWTDNIERLRQAVMGAKNEGSYVTFNEISKETRAKRQEGDTGLDYLLNLTPDSISHVLYLGPQRMGNLPVFVWTDTDIPIRVRQDAQLARRIVQVALDSQVDWQTSMAAAMVRRAADLRTSHLDVCQACNVLLSAITDRYFTQHRSFEEIANMLGFKTLAESPEEIDAKEALVRFFDAVCAAPPASATDAKRWGGRGWKVIIPGGSDPLSQAWAEVADEDGRDSRRCSERDWLKTVPSLAVQMRLKIIPHGSRLAVRFIHTINNKTYLVNEEGKRK